MAEKIGSLNLITFLLPFFILNPDFSTMSVRKPEVSRQWPLYTLRPLGVPRRQNSCRNFSINKPAAED